MLCVSICKCSRVFACACVCVCVFGRRRHETCLKEPRFHSPVTPCTSVHLPTMTTGGRTWEEMRVGMGVWGEMEFKSHEGSMKEKGIRCSYWEILFPHVFQWPSLVCYQNIGPLPQREEQPSSCSKQMGHLPHFECMFVSNTACCTTCLRVWWAFAPVHTAHLC